MSTARLSLMRGPSPGHADRWAHVAKRHLALDDGEAKALLAKLPVVLALELPDPGEQARMLGALEAMSASATLEETPLAYGVCGRHPRLLESELCQRCGERACGACAKLSGRCARCQSKRDRWAKFRRFRIFVLLAILGLVAGTTFLEGRRLARWTAPVRVVVHPIVMEPGAADYARRLGAEQLAPVARFLDAEARRYGVALAPSAFLVSLGAPLPEAPPELPPNPDAWAAIRWSLSFRAWIASMRFKHDLEPADVRMFALFYEPTDGRTLPHSMGLERARAGVAHLFASSAVEGKNQVVLAHEVLHTVGALDQYDESGYPTVLGDPAQAPLYPQRRAAVMAGRLAISANEARIPDGLGACVVSPETATEIGWIVSPRGP